MDVALPERPRLVPEALLAGRYRVECLLGRGGMGEVYRAFDTALERIVAVKVLRMRDAARSTAAQRFVREAKLAARIDDPGCVRVFDGGMSEDGIAYVVMESLSGQTLADVLLAWGSLAPAFALEVAAQVAETLDASHAAGVVHRDVKAGNIFLLATSGGRTRAKLLDFGLARALGSASSLTRTRELFGTLPYMAPEQLHDARRAGIAADVYSLGCVLFEMLAGRLPFVQTSRSALRFAVQHDAPPDLEDLLPGLAPEVCALVRRMLAKDPRERPSHMAEVLSLLTTARKHAQTAVLGTRRERAAPERAGYRIARLLGAGSHGCVYAAEHVASGRNVALKAVPSDAPLQVARLKREYAVLTSVAHPNLVRVDDFWHEASSYVLAMELVEGEPLAAAATSSLETLRTCFSQLADVLAALHAHGVVHRDLKPANVLVERTGRVVLLDLGISARTGERVNAAGTPRYAPPESGRGDVAPSLDLYALGVMLREALDAHPRRTPAAGSAEHDERARLTALAEALTADDETRRPEAVAVRTALLGLAPPSAERPGGRAPEAFVGRADELHRLALGLRETRLGKPVLCTVSGPSGIGKSALVRHFISSIGEPIWLLPARCRSSEAIPFPALDAGIESLVGALEALSARELSPLLPAQAGALTALFPAFARLDAVAELARTEWLPRDPREARALSASALRALLSRLLRVRPVVLWLDDLHWLDPDSSALLRDVLRPPDAPALLLLATCRTEDEPRTDAAVALRRTFVGRELDVALGPLAPLDCHRLVAHAGRTLASEEVHALHARTGGHPLFLQALLHERSGPTTEHTLRDVLQRAVHELSTPARRLLEAISACERPLRRELALRFASADASALLELTSARLANEIPLGGDTALEPYHAQVRTAVLAGLPDDARKSLHAELAALCLASGLVEARVEHLRLLGDAGVAADAAALAAREADKQLAFERAAALYAEAAELSSDPVARLSLGVSRAAALRAAGRMRAAADAYATLSEACAEDQKAELIQRAFELLLMSASVNEAIAFLARTPYHAELRFPEDLGQTLTQSMLALMALRKRGLTPTQRARDDIASDDLARVDVQLAIAQGLSHVDLRSLPFAFRALDMALDLGDVPRLQRAAAVFVWNVGSHFPNELVAPALELARELTPKVGTPLARAVLAAAEAEFLHDRGEFAAAGMACERAEDLLVSQCVGATRELAGVRVTQAFLEYAQKGDFERRVPETLAWLADADARDDIYHANMLRSAHAIVWVARDQPGKARAELARAEAGWPQGVSIFEVSVALSLDVVDRYEQRPPSSLQAAQGRAALLASPVVAVPAVQGYLCLHRAWIALKLSAERADASGPRAEVQKQLTSLRKLEPLVWRAVADGIEANQRLLTGEVDHARALLERSELGFRALCMPCLAACAKKRRGELTDGAVGARITRQAVDELSALGVVAPERFAAAYFSPFPSDAASALTRYSGAGEAGVD